MLSYQNLSQEEYINLLIDMISTTEGHLAQATDTNDSQITIGYGYTFGRNDNVTLWLAAGIVLSDSERQALEKIDAAAADEKNSLALQFTRQITKMEANALLRQTYPRYEGPADDLAMPPSRERAAFVSIVYNRGATTVRRRMQDFYGAILSTENVD